MRPETTACLERVEDALDPDHLAEVRERWLDARHYRPVSHLPLMTVSCAPDWPVVSMEEMQKDPEKMLIAELSRVYACALVQDDTLPTIRANYGTGILPSLFGCEIKHFEHETLPAALPLHDVDCIRDLIAAGVPDLRSGLGGAVLDTVAFYREALAPYEKLRTWVEIDLADTQGPLDAAEIIWGSEVFMYMYGDPALVHAFLDLVTETHIAFTRAHQALDGVPFDRCCNPLGRVSVREDASVMVSGEMYDSFCRPCTQRILNTFGGRIHWCGDGKAWWRDLITMADLIAVNPFQGQFYDPVEMHTACRKEGVMIWQWTTGLTPEQREAIPTGFSCWQWCGEIDAARQVHEAWRSEAVSV